MKNVFLNISLSEGQRDQSSSHPEELVKWPIDRFNARSLIGGDAWLMRYWLQSFNGMEVFLVVAPLQWIQHNYIGEISDDTKALTCWRPSHHAAIIWLDAGLRRTEDAAAALAHEMIHLVRHMCQHINSDIDSEVETSAYTVEYMFQVQLHAWIVLHSALMSANKYVKERASHIIGDPLPIPEISVDDDLLIDNYAGGYPIDTLDKYNHVLDVLNSRKKPLSETHSDNNGTSAE